MFGPKEYTLCGNMVKLKLTAQEIIKFFVNWWKLNKEIHETFWQMLSILEGNCVMFT